MLSPVSKNKSVLSMVWFLSLLQIDSKEKIREHAWMYTIENNDIHLSVLLFLVNCFQHLV